jgi:hypothetical protein
VSIELHLWEGKRCYKDVTIMEKNILVKTNKTRWKMVEMTRKFLANGSYIVIKN